MGEIIGQFELQDVLGGGGMATVYRAEHRSGIGMRAAVKKLHPHLAADVQLRKRLRVEAQALARLEHRNVVRLLDYVDEDGSCALVTELVEGHTLRTEIENDGLEPMPLERALNLFGQMLDGVGHAHDHQCLHRDIKPGNVMVTENGSVKVLDFGIASLLDTEGLTRTGVSIGTPAYMAPEQVDGMEGLDERADIYALGVTFWEMLAGPGARTRRKAWRLGPEGFERLRRLGLPEPLIALVESMAEADPDGRPMSIADVKVALQAAIDGLEAPTDGVSTVTWTMLPDEPTVSLSDGEPVARRAGRQPSRAEGVTPDAPTLRRDVRPDTSSRARGLGAGEPTLKRDLRPETSRRAKKAGAGEPTRELAPGSGTRKRRGEGTTGTAKRRKKASESPSARKPTGNTTMIEPGPRWLPWLGGGTALVALALLGGAMLRGPSLAEVRGGAEVTRDLKGLTDTVFFDRGAFYYGPEDRKVVLSAFALDSTEVTLGQWGACVRSEGWACPDVAGGYVMIGGIEHASEDEPVQFVSWPQAMAFCAWRGSSRVLPPGFVARLPTDAEWERAARGPARPGRRYPHGDAFDRAMATVSGSRLPPAGSTAQDRSPDGVSDLTGSVEEWVLDAGPSNAPSEQTDHSYLSASTADPVGAASLTMRGVRGGSQERGGIQEEFYRSQGRRWVQASRTGSGRGFRCAYGVAHGDGT